MINYNVDKDILHHDDEQFNIFKNKIPETVREHISPHFSFGDNVVTFVLNEDNNIIFKQILPLFLFPKTYLYFCNNFNNTKPQKIKNKISEDKINNLFQIFFFEFGKYYHLANDITYLENQNLTIYDEIYNNLNVMYKNYYGNDKDMSPSEICFYSNIILNFTKELLNEIEDIDLFEDFHLWLMSSKDSTSNIEGSYLHLLTSPTINLTPT